MVFENDDQICFQEKQLREYYKNFIIHENVNKYKTKATAVVESEDNAIRTTRKKPIKHKAAAIIVEND